MQIIRRKRTVYNRNGSHFFIVIALACITFWAFIPHDKRSVAIVKARLPHISEGYRISDRFGCTKIYYGQDMNGEFHLQLNNKIRPLPDMPNHLKTAGGRLMRCFGDWTKEYPVLLYIDKETPMADVWKIKKELTEADYPFVMWMAY